MDIKGKTAIVTGGAGDLGRAVVAALVAAGAEKVTVLDIKNVEKTGKIDAISCNLSDFTQVFDVLSGHPPVDIVINNAGILHSAPLVNMLDKTDASLKQHAADWRRVIDVNLSSAFYVSQIMAGKMARARKKGVVVNIGSVAAQGTAGQSAYSASKAGVHALTMVWAKELGPLGIRAVAVAPGYMDTPSTAKAVSEAQLKDITAKIPLKKLGNPESAVQAVLFAIENDYVNGTVIEIDGGLCV